MATKFIRHIVFFQRKALLQRRLHSNQLSSRSPGKNNSSFREPTPEQKEWYKTRKNTTDAIYDKVVKGYWIGPTFLSVAALWHVLFSKKDESCGLDHLQKIIPNKNCSTTSTQPLIFKNTSPSSFSGDSQNVNSTSDYARTKCFIEEEEDSGADISEISDSNHHKVKQHFSKTVVAEEIVEDELDQDEETDEKIVRKSPNGIPENVPYLIIGGGTASFSAMRSIRAFDPRAKVLIISEELGTPYMRPPLTKELWYSQKWKSSCGQLSFKTYSGRERSIFFEKEAFYTDPAELEFNEKGGIGILRGHKVVSINSEDQKVILDDGRQIKYGKCLIATGGRPRTLQSLEGIMSSKKLTTFRNLVDFETLDELTNGNENVKSIAIIGSGFLGTELTTSLAIKGKEQGFDVVQIFPEKGVLSRVLPEYLSDLGVETIRKTGVTVIPNASKISAKCLQDGKIELKINEDHTVLADHVVVAAGIEPNTQLAVSAGIDLDDQNGGIAANEFLETSKKNIFVAGDVASYPGTLGNRRLEHHDNAIITGKHAGDSMIGIKNPMNGHPMFWTDVGQEIGIEGIGNVDSRLETIAVFAKDQADEEFDRGVVFYKDSNEVIVGILLWNIFNQMSTARRIVKENKRYDDISEVAKLFQMYKPIAEETTAAPPDTEMEKEKD